MSLLFRHEGRPGGDALCRLGIAEAARRLEAGELTAVALAQACLERIRARDGQVRAFVAHDPALVLRDAARADAVGPGRALLRGIPFAVKDVIDSADYPTARGSSIHARRRPLRDAGCVAAARERGAVLLGKVATSEFATQTPGPSRNPLALDHTPGGSSSGSAAAVADGMAFAAWGTQTTGSVIRPAVYCGIVGYKPSFGLVSTDGVSTLSPSQDTVGVLARSVEDAALFAFGIHTARPVLDTASALARPLRLAVCTSSQWAHARPETVAAIEDFASRASAAGAKVRRVPLPPALEALVEAQPRLVAYEARHALAHERTHHAGQLSRRLTERLEDGAALDLADHLALLQQAAAGRHAAAALFDGVDAVLYPATEGEAEPGLENSGSPRFGALWSLLHLPAVAYPVATGPRGLPLGLQLIGPYAGDPALLAVAAVARGFVRAGAHGTFAD